MTYTLQREKRQVQGYTETLPGGLPLGPDGPSETIALEMVIIPAGTFTMGSPPEELDRRDNEGPLHEVTLDTFAMGRYPITQAQWQAVATLPQINQKLAPNPSRFQGNDNRPVEQVSWEDAVEFCKRLSVHSGRPYSLPSEAQWEYACRAGTTTPFHFGDTLTPDAANYDGNYTYGNGPQGEYRQETTPVGYFGVANAFGLYDMHGNVCEWCQDDWHDTYENAPTDGSAWIDETLSGKGFRVLRGGSWLNSPRYCRSACRFNFAPGTRNNNLGFRVVVSLART